MTEGNIVKFESIMQYVSDASHRVVRKEVGFDPWNAYHLAQELQASHDVRMVEMRQGIPTLGAPSKAFEDVINEHRMTHGGNAVLTRQASEVCIETDTNGNFRPIKTRRKRFSRIDGIIACVMALGRAQSMDASETIIDSCGFVA